MPDKIPDLLQPGIVFADQQKDAVLFFHEIEGAVKVPFYNIKRLAGHQGKHLCFIRNQVFFPEMHH